MSGLEDSTREAESPATRTVSDTSVDAALGWFGEFALQAEIGVDGPFTLYRARQPRLNRTVLLKLPTRREQIEENLPWFLRREAEVCAQLDHPAILRALESGEIAGVPYLAFAAVDGVSLVTHLRRGPVPAQQALSWMRQLCEAIFTAYRSQQLIHANLRPEYVFIQQDGQVRLTGFGTSDRPAEVTGYLAPERLPGFAKRVAEKADVYGLGALLHALLTGRPPHVANDQDKLERAIRSAEIVPPRRINASVSRDLDALCTQCLIREPYRRYSLKPLMSDCLRALSGRPVLARSGLWWRTPLAWGRRNGRVLTSVATIILGIALPTLWETWRTSAAWQTLMSEPPAAEWTDLPPIADPAAAAQVSSDREVLVIRTMIPDGVRSIHALRLESVPKSDASDQEANRPLGDFVLTDVQGVLGEPDLKRSLRFEKARADYSHSGFPAIAAIDDQPEQTGWSSGAAVGDSHFLELTLRGRTPVIPGEPLTIQLKFGILPRAASRQFRVSIEPDSKNAARHERQLEQAARYFRWQYKQRPHDDAVKIGHTAARLLHDPQSPHYSDLYARYAGPIEQGLGAVPCVDPRWQRSWRQLFAIAAIRDGGYSRAQSEIERKDGIRYERAGYAFEVRFQEVNCPSEPRLAAEFNRLRKDGDILAQSIRIRDEHAVAAAVQAEPTSSLICSLLLARANYVPVSTRLPVAAQPFFAANMSASNWQSRERYQQFTEAAATSLQQIAIDWPQHPGARLAIPALAEQLAEPAGTHRDVAQQLLQQIDPNWHRLPEAQRAIPGLVLRLAGSADTPRPTRQVAREILHKIDLNWRKSPEVLDAIPVLIEVLTLLSNNSPSRHDGPQQLRPMVNDWLFVSNDPMTAVNVLLELGPGAKSAIPALKALQEQAPANVRQAIQAALDQLDKK